MERYESPLGFTMNYPSSWLVQDEASTTVVIIANHERSSVDPSSDATGHAWVEVSRISDRVSDVAKVGLSCSADQGGWTQTTEATTFANRQAVHCASSGPSVHSVSKWKLTS